MTSISHPPLELWYSHRGGATATAIAVRKGWLQDAFAGSPVRVRSLEDADSRDIRLAHYHHGASGLVREAGNVSAIWARSQGQNAVVVGITWVDEYQGILVRRDSGIHSLSDLRRRRLGLPLRRHALVDLQRASAQRGFVTALELAGLDPRLAFWVHIQSPDFEYPQHSPGLDIELDALRSGYVDAVFLRGAAGYKASRDPALRELVDLNRQQDPLLRANHGTPRPITVDRAFLERHPRVVGRYLEVLIRAADWARGHPDQVPPLLLAENPGCDAADIVGAHGTSLHRGLLPSLAPLHVAGLSAQKDFLLDWGYLRQDFSIADWVDPVPLTQALQPRHSADSTIAPPTATPILLKEHIHVH